MIRIVVATIFIVAISISKLNAQTDSIPGLGIITPTVDSNSLSGWYIPTNMAECLDELDNTVPESIKDSFKLFSYEQIYQKYAYLNQWMLNSWKIWDSSVIVQYFNKYGFIDPAEISRSIFLAYWKHLNDLPLKISAKPDYYALGTNLEVRYAEKHYQYPNNPAIYGKIIHTADAPQFTYMDMKFTLMDSLYSVIMKILYDNGYNPSERLLYVWWTKVAQFGYEIEKPPLFLTEEELKTNYNDGASYTVDYILIIDSDNSEELLNYMTNYQYDETFFEYVKKLRNISFHLIKKREVVDFD